MYRAHKITLDPNNVQCSMLNRYAGASRFTYNWVLERWIAHSENRNLNGTDAKRFITLLIGNISTIRHERFPWMLEIPECIPQQAIRDMEKALDNYFAGRKPHPVFHRRGVHDSFKMMSGTYQVDAKRIYLQGIGWIRMREELRYPHARILSVTVSRTADRWFAAILCSITHTDRKATPQAKLRIMGVDVGVREFVFSDGRRFQVPKAYHHAEKSLRRAQKDLSRKEKGSENYHKQRTKVARLYQRAANIRIDWLHKLSSIAVNENIILVIENLDVQSMMSNKVFAKSVADASFGEFRRQVEYKATEIGHRIVVADRFFPSSKLCSECGVKNDQLVLSQRVWTCDNCGATHDRDLNAARNLALYAASPAVSACGEFQTAGVS
jgi:putative transposase